MKTIRCLLALALLAPLAACDTYEGESEYDVAPGTAVDGEDLDALNEDEPAAEQSNDENDGESSNQGFEAECGDAIVTEGEECDDGVMNGDSAACTAECRIAVCGDGLLYADGEECDEGADNGSGACNENCELG